MLGGLRFLGLPDMNLVRSSRNSSRTLATNGRKLSTISPRLSFIVLSRRFVSSPQLGKTCAK